MMTIPKPVEYARKHREEVLSLMFYSPQTHIHLDWHKPGMWLELAGTITQLLYDQDQLIGLMGVSQPLNGASWLRLIALAEGYDAAVIMPLMWDALVPRAVQAGAHSISVLVINTWLNHHLPELNFDYIEEVVTLHRPNRECPPLSAHDLTIRNGYVEDTHAILEVDHAAFAPPWQMSVQDIRQSQRQAASCTVAMLEQRIIGYEISTRHHTSGHLARLAVFPDMQGQKVGAVLLDQLIRKFSKRGVRSMTVNTQMSNFRSQRLYERYGFRRNSFDFSTWTCNLNP